MADDQKLGCAQRFGNNESCIAAVQNCRVEGENLSSVTGKAHTCEHMPPHCTGTFSLKIKRGSMNFLVR